jgi:hypothetical protein
LDKEFKVEETYCKIETEENLGFSKIEITLIELALLLNNTESGDRKSLYKKAIESRDEIESFLNARNDFERMDEIEKSRNIILNIEKLLTIQINKNNNMKSLKDFYIELAEKNESLSALHIQTTTRIDDEISVFYSDSLATKSFILRKVEFMKAVTN